MLSFLARLLAEIICFLPETLYFLLRLFGNHILEFIGSIVIFLIFIAIMRVLYREEEQIRNCLLWLTVIISFTFGGYWSINIFGHPTKEIKVKYVESEKYWFFFTRLVERTKNKEVIDWSKLVFLFFISACVVGYSVSIVLNAIENKTSSQTPQQPSGGQTPQISNNPNPTQQVSGGQTPFTTTNQNLPVTPVQSSPMSLFTFQR
jgi:hypothetical protein